MNIKNIIAITFFVTLGVAGSFFALQYYTKSYQDHDQMMMDAFQDIDQKIQTLQVSTKQDDKVVLQCGIKGASCSQSSACCSGCCWSGTCQNNDDMCCAVLNESCTGQLGNTHGTCCTEYICGQCYVPENSAGYIQAAPAGESGLCQTNSTYILLSCGSGGLGAPCFSTAECQSQYVCLNNECSAKSSDVPSRSGSQCTSSSECSQGNCYDGFCKSPKTHGMRCDNDGQCDSDSCVADGTNTNVSVCTKN
jgi:hypothetical protein